MAYTNIDDPSAYFSATIYTGDGSADQSMTGAGFQPDFLWIKRRNASERHVLTNTQMDVSDGAYKWLDSADTHVEFSGGTGVESFDSDGFTIKTSDATWNASGSTYVFWSWKCNGGTTASNTDGDINSTVQVNQDAGFSIVNYTGNGSTSDQTIGHGLGVRANAVIVKNKDSAVNWVVWSEGVDANHSLELNTTDGISDSTQGRVLSNTGSRGTSTIFSIRSGSGSVVQTNTSGEDYVAYCFAEKQGYSKFGGYVGNGNDNGPFIYTGFKPAFVLTKGNHVSQWRLYDSARSPNNVNINRLFPYTDVAEATDTDAGIDMLSNGFKIRGSGGDYNASGQAYIYMAFADNPFVTSTGIPTTAR